MPQRFCLAVLTGVLLAGCGGMSPAAKKTTENLKHGVNNVVEGTAKAGEMAAEDFKEATKRRQ